MLTENTRTRVPANIREKAAADRNAIYTSIMESIRRGEFPEGCKLPTERELSVNFGAARNTVRRAIDTLVEEGTVTRQVGRGTYVTGGASDSTVSADPKTTPSLQEILEGRLLFEPEIANLVVERADDADFDAMNRCLEGIRGAQDWSSYKEWKYELHMTVVRATRNRFLIQIFEAVIRARREDHWGRRGDDTHIPAPVREASLRANTRIVQALRQGRVEEARVAIRDYLTGILASVHGF